jgi:hypothetical protein
VTPRRESLGQHRRSAPQGPKRTTEELAESLGITAHALAGRMAHGRERGLPPPEPTAISRAGGSKRTYYDLRAFRQWWAAYNRTEE